MDEEKISTSPFVMVPAELVRSGLSSNAILCFCAMGSFGPESRAKVSTIGKRMRRSNEKTVRKAQAELIGAGFIKLIKESSEHSPREWALWPYKKDKTEGSENGGGLFRGVGNDPLKQIINQTDNITNQTDKKDTPMAQNDSAAPQKVNPKTDYVQIASEAFIQAGLALTSVPWSLRTLIQKKGDFAGEEMFRVVLKDYLVAAVADGHSIGGFAYTFDKGYNKRNAARKRESAEANAQLQRYLKGR